MNVIYLGNPIDPAEQMFCSYCDGQVNPAEVVFAWLGHDKHAHLVVGSSCCSATIVDRRDAHKVETVNEVRTVGQIAAQHGLVVPDALKDKVLPNVSG